MKFRATLLYLATHKMLPRQQLRKRSKKFEVVDGILQGNSMTLRQVSSMDQFHELATLTFYYPSVNSGNAATVMR